MKIYSHYIGIDPGVITGIALWDKVKRKLVYVSSMSIHVAMEKVKEWHNGKTLVRVEDARKRNWFGRSNQERLQGAGSIKRDARIWEDFLTDLDIPFELVAPKSNKTKLTAVRFKLITGHKGSTNEHSRDAAMLVFGI